MKKIFLFLFSILAFVQSYAQNPDYQFAMGLGATVKGGTDEGNAIKTDGSGNILVTGTYEGLLDFDPSASIFNKQSSGGKDFFLAKYNSTGAFLWSLSIGGVLDEENPKIAIDASNNIIITGTLAFNSVYNSPVDFDPSAATANVSANCKVLFIAKYDASGNFLWVKSLGNECTSGGIFPIFANAITLDGSDNIFIAGNFSGTVDFDPSAATTSFTAGTYGDIFFAKYTSTGGFAWAKPLFNASTNAFNNRGTSIVLDASNNILLSGISNGTVDFDPSAATANLTGTNSYFIAKYDNLGNYIWAKNILTGLNSNPTIILDINNNIFLTGNFRNTVDFDPSAGVANQTSVGDVDVFFAKYTSAGAYVWVKVITSQQGQYDYPLEEIASSILIDASGNLYLTGFFLGVTDFDPSAGVANLTSTNFNVNTSNTLDIFLAKYDASGNYVWAKNIGGNSEDLSNAMSMDNAGNLIITGNFLTIINEYADFDPSASVANISSTFGNSTFIAKYTNAGSFILAYKFNENYNENDQTNVIRTDAAGNRYVFGNFRGIVDFDPSANVANLTGTMNSPFNSGDDIFLAKYNANGSYLWAINYNVSGTTENALDLELDASGNAYILFTFANGSSLSYRLRKYDSNGNFVRAYNVPHTGKNIALDASGNLYITGTFYGLTTFSTSPSVTMTPVDGYDAYLAKYDNAGVYQWAKQLGGVDDETGTDIKIDNAGNVIFTGDYWTDNYFLAKYDAAGTNLWTNQFVKNQSEYYGASIAIDGSNNIYLRGDAVIKKINSAGTQLWSKDIYTGAENLFHPITLDSQGNVYVAGGFYDTIDLDPSAAVVTLTSVGDFDIFIAKYDASGNYIFAKSMGSLGVDFAYSINIDANGNVILGGTFSNTVDFDPDAGIANFTAQALQDAFVAVFSTNGIFQTIVTGNWNANATWNTNTPPTAANTAKINSTHTVSIPNTGNQVKTIQMNGGIINLNGGTLEIKNTPNP